MGYRRPACARVDREHEREVVGETIHRRGIISGAESDSTRAFTHPRELANDGANVAGCNCTRSPRHPQRREWPWSMHWFAAYHLREYRPRVDAFAAIRRRRRTNRLVGQGGVDRRDVSRYAASMRPCSEGG